MAHWAEIDENKKVIRVIVGDNSLPGEGYDWIMENLGGTWLKTSYNGTIRKHFAGPGFTYDESRDAFVPPKPESLPSWVLDEETLFWVAPVPMPDDSDTVDYIWDESTISWVEVVIPDPS